MATTISLKRTFASLPRTTRGQFIVINGDPKVKNFLYCNGTQVYIRNLEDASICDIYSEHAKETTVAKYSPSGFYIASGDAQGKIRVWDTVNPEHILKIEHAVIGGAIKDIDWSSDNTKLVAGGEGRQLYSRVFTFDSGNSVGDITGHTKAVNSVSFKPTRPFRLISGSEDFEAIFFEGPPFKFSCTKREATNFVNCVRYAPDGTVFVIASQEGKIWVYDGKTSELIGELGEPKAHKGGVYSVCFSADSKQLLSVSGDKTSKVWNMESRTCETEFVMGKDLLDMQVGCTWVGDHLITVSLSGHINFLDKANPTQPKKIIKGHNKPITALDVSPDGSRIYSASYEGLMVEWDTASGNSENFKGKGHTNQVMDLAIDGDYLVSTGWDDTVRFHKKDSREYGESVKTDSQPWALDAKNGIAVVVCLKEVLVFESSGKKLSSLPIKYEGRSCSIHPNGTEVSVGSDTAFYVYSLSNGVLTETRKESSQGVVAALSYSPDGSNLAASDSKNVRIYDASTWENLTGNWSSQHSAKVTCLSWSPDSRRLMAGSIDSFISVWELGKIQGQKPSVKAHPMSHINKLKWLDNHTVVTAGQDANLKIWSVSE